MRFRLALGMAPSAAVDAHAHMRRMPRNRAWYHRQRKTGASTIQDVPPVVHEELYCPNCYLRRTVHQDGQQYRYAACGTTLELPKAPGAYPERPTGAHHPFREVRGWVYSQCGIPMLAQE
jgi:hypothetical protein